MSVADMYIARFTAKHRLRFTRDVCVCTCADAVMLVNSEGKPQPFADDDSTVSAAALSTDVHRLIDVSSVSLQLLSIALSLTSLCVLFDAVHNCFNSV